MAEISEMSGGTLESNRKPYHWWNFRQGRDGSKRFFLASSLIPVLLYMAFWTLLPIVWAFALAFFEYSARRQGGSILGLGGDNPFVGLQHFRAMLDFSPDAPLNVRQFHTAVKTTLLFAFLVVPLNLAITLPLAAMIESLHTRWKVGFRTLFFLPVVTSSVGVAIMWGFVFHPQRGLLNGIITLVTGKLTAINWVGDQSLVVGGIPVALLAVIVAYLWQDIGYNLIIFIAALQSIPDTIREAAIIDGASGFKMFRHITLPLLKPTIYLAAVLTMISAFQVFDIIQVMTDGGPNDQTRVMVIDIYDYAFRFQRMGWAAAVSTVLFAIVLTISLVQSRLLRTDWEY
ncbi:MAG: carbohydrate ABC transporter permease [Candidatus Promineifilaceae bacterium]|jgi:multiple sugar transport system permease protein/raffinose/stachyose/melibiose transport system permease protein